MLFIDAAQEGHFRSGRARNFLDPEHIGAIVKAYEGFEDVDRFAHVAGLEEISANDFNLNIFATASSRSRSARRSRANASPMSMDSSSSVAST